MELSEVANVQFAVPIIGVVVCAVLVFAFGFKSPGQPSFDALYEDDRKSKRIRNRRSGGTHGDKHKNVTSATSASDEDDETTGQLPTTKSAPDASKHQLNGIAGSSSSGRALNGTIADAASRSQVKVVKSEEPVQIIPKEDRVSVGGWTTAVSKKDKKNRGKKDESVKLDKPVMQNDKVKPAFPNFRDASRPVKNNKKLSELTTVTVVVPGPPSSNNSITETSTTITETAVIKVKVVPGVRVSVNTTPNGHAVMDRRNVPRPSAPVVGVALPAGSSRVSTVAPWAKLDGDSSKLTGGSSDKPALILGFDDWTEVQSSRSPKKKRGTVEESQDKPKDASSSVADCTETMYNQLSTQPSTSAANDKVSAHAGIDGSAASKSSSTELASTVNYDSANHISVQDTRSAVNDTSSSSSSSSSASKGQTPVSSGGDGLRKTSTAEDVSSNNVDDEEPGTNEKNGDGSPAIEVSGDWQEAKTVKKKKRNSKSSGSHDEN